MKLVELLAKKLDVWPSGAAIAVQDGDKRKTVKFGGEHANPSIALLGRESVWQAEKWNFNCQSDFDHSVLASDWKTAKVTEKQWKAERDRQKGGEWKRHRGGKMPVETGVRIEVKHRDGEVYEDEAGGTYSRDWSHTGAGGDIMKYRVISPPQAEDGLELVQGAQDAVISCIAHNDGAGNVTHGPIMMGDEVVGEASPEWHQQAKWDQIETPFKWRDEVTELNAYIEKYTRERDALIERLASEGFALIPPVVSVVSEFSGVDMSDWRNWKAGDIVVCAENYSKQFTQGKKYELSGLDNDERYPRVQIKSDDMGEVNGWGAERFKFHSRP